MSFLVTLNTLPRQSEKYNQYSKKQMSSLVANETRIGSKQSPHINSTAFICIRHCLENITSLVLYSSAMFFVAGLDSKQTFTKLFRQVSVLLFALERENRRNVTIQWLLLLLLFLFGVNNYKKWGRDDGDGYNSTAIL